MQKTKLIILFSIFSVFGVSAQELNCDVQINSSKIQGTNKDVFNTLQTAISEFMNNRRWTDLAYENNERINCSMSIIINSVEADEYSAEVVIQSNRPIFNTTYTTTLLNYRDEKFSFTYQEFDPLEFNENSLTSSLTATLAYYAYLIIGYDMDSFSRFGGTPYFQVAENIVSQAQSTNWSGWKAFESDKNRYALINNIMDEAFKKYRGYFYDYHRLGLDIMSANVTNGRAKIAEGINVLQEAYRARPTAVVINSFLNAKSDEIINIFKEGTTNEKKQVHEVLTTIDPAKSNRYDEILRN